VPARRLQPTKGLFRPPVQTSRSVAETNGLVHPPLPAFRADAPCGYLQNVLNKETKLMIHWLVRASTRLRFDEEGQTIVEYALILALVSTAAFTLLSAIGDFPASVFSLINSDL
jgi:Flp pilus assembly pilin Flp